VFEEVIAGELSETPPDAAEDYSAAIQQLAASGRFAVLSPAQTALIDVSSAVVFGDAGARVMIAEFSDFQCPFCRRWEQQYGQELRARLGGDIALAFFHFPIQQIHPNAPFASIAAVCAADQGRFWEMHDLLFARQDEWAGLPR
jgi:protein-disulfide isomerase